MKRKFAPLLILVGSICASVQPVQAQGLLERLEGRLNNLLAPPANAPQPNAGEPGYLGLVVDDEPEQRGIRVLAVRPGSPAEIAGFRVDDQLTQINGQAVARVEDMAVLLDRQPAGSKVQFDIRRDNRASRLNVTLGQRAPADPVAGEPPRRIAPDRPAIGLTVAPLTDEARARYNLTVRRGALITAITPGGPAHRAGLPIGGVIVAYDGRPIVSADELIAAVRGARIGDEVELSYYEGDQLQRKSLHIAPAEGAEVEIRRRPPGDAPLAIRPGEDRGAPAIGRLERLIEGVVRPPAPGIAPAPRADIEDILALRRQIEAMQLQIDELQKRVEDLDKRVPPLDPAPPARP